MKRAVLLLATVLLATATINAQHLRLGLKAGMNFSSNSGEGMNTSMQQGLDVGAFAEVGLGKKWDFQPEIYYSHREPKRADNFKVYYNEEALSGSNTDIKLNYISVPLLVKYHVSSVISVEAGPQYNILFFEDDNLLKNDKDAFKKSDIGIAAGATLLLDKFRIYGRYTQGLTNGNDTGNKNGYKWKSHQLQLGVGFVIF